MMFLYKHLLVRRRNARSSGDEEGSAVRNGRAYCYGKAVNRVAPDESTQSLVRSVFLHQSDKWHNEATSLNVRAVSVSLPVGLCRRQKGETREEGGHALDMFALTNITAVRQSAPDTPKKASI